MKLRIKSEKLLKAQQRWKLTAKLSLNLWNSRVSLKSHLKLCKSESSPQSLNFIYGTQGKILKKSCKLPSFYSFPHTPRAPFFFFLATWVCQKSTPVKTCAIWLPAQPSPSCGCAPWTLFNLHLSARLAYRASLYAGVCVCESVKVPQVHTHTYRYTRTQEEEATDTVENVKHLATFCLKLLPQLHSLEQALLSICGCSTHSTQKVTVQLNQQQ